MPNNLVDEFDSVSNVIEYTRNPSSKKKKKKRKKRAEHDYAKKISPPALTQKDEYVSIDVGLCKHKKNCGRRLFSFPCLRRAKFKHTRIEHSSQMGEIDERMRLFPLAIVF